jgi:hypothetical protein
MNTFIKRGREKQSRMLGLSCHICYYPTIKSSLDTETMVLDFPISRTNKSNDFFIYKLSSVRYFVIATKN